ncbi:hypothetical protein CANCADRAFT_32936 [Tortispora caseinolytica NRRL Y-17796]|uniref:Hyaluronan/mRNA-binding protein domain-containing protein n=1 Tax=Tortispora caseinolytica NRRL Y-17796 TaxID=767744 RepID=A0A1E4TDF2_9ASCO|nr:hypothetical protein CANCADRAFT_32936 [Tortispora caseinolytica NRRL Y-17796]
MARSGSFSNESLPKNYGKATEYVPTTVKKNGAGRGNWGRPGEELEDVDYPISYAHPRRRSNSSTERLDFKSKFEVDDVFDEE